MLVKSTCGWLLVAVPEAAVPGEGFDRVAGRVAEVQHAPGAALALVTRHDVGLDRAALGNHRHQRRLDLER